MCAKNEVNVSHVECSAFAFILPSSQEHSCVDDSFILLTLRDSRAQNSCFEMRMLHNGFSGVLHLICIRHASLLTTNTLAFLIPSDLKSFLILELQLFDSKCCFIKFSFRLHLPFYAFSYCTFFCFCSYLMIFNFLKAN